MVVQGKGCFEALFLGAGDFGPWVAGFYRACLVIRSGGVSVERLARPLLQNPSRDFCGAVPADVCCEVSFSFAFFMNTFTSLLLATACGKFDGHAWRVIRSTDPRKLVSPVALDVAALPGGDGAKVSVTKHRGVGGKFREDGVQPVADENSGFFFESIYVAVAVAVAVAIGDDSRWEDLHGALRGGAHA